ncbi:hypothetical protein ACFC6L_23345 [Kitasatospora phosalacinea]|uniref:hypothetical protein n=1 Tax=Kitasatospora phosalacinea TaxID=2065 RepID=UPI0035D96680
MSVPAATLAGRDRQGSNVLDNVLTADVPLGPFAGKPITVHSATSKNAKFHATRSCSMLRAREVVTAEVPLNAETTGRMCAQCGRWSGWARSGTGLGIFLRALGGVGLLYQLRTYTEPDQDENWTDDEVRAAAALLRSAPEADSEDEEPGEEDAQAREDAEHLRGRVRATWRGAAKSLHLAEAVLSLYDWLGEWAEPALAAKRQYLEVLRTQAALFVPESGLLEAAAVGSLKKPELPSEETAFAALGNRAEVTKALESLWSDWQHRASGSCDPADERWRVVYGITGRLRSNRKGYDQLCSAVDELVVSWEGLARAAVEAAGVERTRQVTVRLAEAVDDSSAGYERGFLADLDEWCTGVLVTYLVDADWGRRALTLDVPRLVVDRLLASRSLFTECGLRSPEHVESRKSAVRLTPGVFDDTPVFDRLPIHADHLRALNAAPVRGDELCLGFSPGAGTEVLPLSTLATRVAAGWNGTVIARASDLPGSVIEPWIEEIGPRPTEGERIWPPAVHDPYDPRFGADLGHADGARMTAWLGYDDRFKQYDLRCLAMARGAGDLRTLDSGHDREGRRRTVSSPVWHGLLASAEYLDLQPFRAPGTDRWRDGSGIPLGVLADVQVYTTDADPGWQRKGHSPFCQHARERGVQKDDDLLRVADLLARSDFDWCSKCHGYAIRRFTDTQLSYYRAAHQLHDIAEELRRDSDKPLRTDGELLAERLTALTDWHPEGEDYWNAPESWRWREIVRELRTRLATRRQTS